MARADTPDAALAKAIAQHQAGRIDEAIRLYRQVVRKAPKDAAALNLLGLACCQRGGVEEGVEWIGKALALKPDLPGARFNLASMLHGLGRFDDAIEQYRAALSLNPQDGEALGNLAAVLSALKRYDDAIPYFQRAVALKPGDAALHFNFGNALSALGRHDGAAQAFQRVVALRPDQPEGHYNLGNSLYALSHHEDAIRSYERAFALKPGSFDVLVNIGNSLQALNRHAEALRYYDRALAIDPKRAEAHNGRGNALRELGRHDEAIASIERAIALRPNHHEGYFNLANAFATAHRREEAIAQFERALAINPRLADAHFNLAVVLDQLERLEDAQLQYDRAMTLDPNFAKSAWNRAMLLLNLGRFADGWELYDKRFNLQIVKRREYPQPSWKGEQRLARVIAWGEQGLGDHILHAGMVPQLQDRVDELVLEIEPRLVSLMARSFPGAKVIAASEELYDGPADAQISLASLGQYFRRSWDDFPRRAFLVADADRAAGLRERLIRPGQTLVGISWVSRSATVGVAKTAPLRDFAPLLRMPGVRCVDLQYGDTQAEREAVAAELGIAVEHLDDIDNMQDIDGLAALIMACDLVVTVSNTTAHLAGALGAPTWVMVPPHGEARFWYWFRDRPESPWYPRVQVRHQAAGESWADTIARTVTEVGAFLGQRRAPQAVEV